MKSVSLAAEFPNDNPAIHRGVSWVCLDVTGCPTAVGEPQVAAKEIEAVPEAVASGIVSLGQTPRDELLFASDEPIVVEELPPLGECVCTEGNAEVPERSINDAMVPPPFDPWMQFVSTLMDVAIGAGSAYVASLLPGLLLEGKLEQVSAEVAAVLSSANIVRAGVVTPSFLAKTRAWRGVLLGVSDDFAACGNAMLDEWAADLLAHLAGAPTRAKSFKGALRSHGVAAFGLAVAAA